MNREFAKKIVEVGMRKVLLAVSGGIDSMCMGELFAGLAMRDEKEGEKGGERSGEKGGEGVAAGERGMELGVAHCNFGLRGEESDGDEALVREWGEKHGIPVHVKRFGTVEYARERRISIEMAARELRYGWFAELCREHGYEAVAVAHNANDNAETLVLNLLRGAGMNGLAGMSLISEIPAGDFLCQNAGQAFRKDSDRRTPKIIRPLLGFTRKQIEGFMFARKLPYRTDSTNASSEYRRNRIRNEVFPIFETVNPSFIRTLNRETGYFAEAGEIVEDYCRAIVPALVSENPDGTAAIDTEGLMAQKHWRYLMYFILEPYGFNSATLASISDLLSSDRTVSGKSFASVSHELKMERNHMVISPLSPSWPGSPYDSDNFDGSADYSTISSHSGNTDIMPVRGDGIYHFNGRSFKVEVLPWTSGMPLKQPEGTIIMDAGKLKFPFVLRAWRSGDWFIPLGMRGKKKVSDLFTDLKYTSLQKRDAVMIIDVQNHEAAETRHIAGIACTRIDNSYRVSDKTISVIKLTEL